jgi:hypothetical protein
MDDYKESKQELLATIERRFQFIIILVLFLPFISDNLVRIMPGTTDGRPPFIGIIISYTFIIYLLFEIFRKKINRKLLEPIALLLILFSYTLIIVIGFCTDQHVFQSLWKYIALDVSILGSIILPFIITILIVIDPIKYFIHFIKSKI